MTSKQADQNLADIASGEDVQRQRHRWRREHERNLTKRGASPKRDV
nr:hypothetical protein [uncultured Campylobacter sp.]